jgi:hypothetical protein
MVIAKLALFERCTDTKATEALHNSINAAAEGKPEFFHDIESADADTSTIRDYCPEAWHAHVDFIRDWVASSQNSLVSTSSPPSILRGKPFRCG